jgi:hypothetical protein
MAQLDEAKLHSFVGKMLGDLGGAFSVPTVRVGLRLGLFETLNRVGPVSAAGHCRWRTYGALREGMGTGAGGQWLYRLRRYQ